ncbi:MAG: hypothetical protein BWY54_01011 [Candidatus Dependentiae bacterium ADurb.Bin331]|nr:MAG: hypothetical protein BWY54_01011 [Candidatus Dependentiae bacterium ADurb.Bin331]
MKIITLFVLMFSCASALNAMDKKEKINEQSKIRREEMRAKLNVARKQARANQKKHQPNNLSNQTDQTAQTEEENFLRHINDSHFWMESE